MNSKAIQKKFFDAITSSEKCANEETSLYKELVFNRYDTVLSSVFPRLKKLMGIRRFKRIVEKFIEEGAKTPFISLMPLEFAKFAKKGTSGKERDIIRYETMLIKTFYKKRADKRDGVLSGNARIKKFSYNPLKNPPTKEKTILLFYQDSETGDTSVQTLTPFLRFFVKNLKRNGIEKSLRKSCKKFRTDFRKSKKTIEPLIKEWTGKGVIDENKV